MPNWSRKNPSPSSDTAGMRTGATIPPPVLSILEFIVSKTDSLTSPDVRRQMIQDLYREWDEYVFCSFIDELPEQFLDEYERLAKANATQPQLIQFFNARLPNIPGIMKRSTTEFVRTYLSDQEIREFAARQQK